MEVKDKKLWLEGLVLLGPIAFILGNVAGDIWTFLMIIALLTQSIATSSYRWLQQPWVIAAFAFCLWAVTSSLTSIDPASSLIKAVGWIRFPLMALALAVFVGPDPARFRRLLAWMALISLVLVIAVFVDRALHPDVAKLLLFYGNPKAGWLLRTIGFVPACIAFALVLDGTIRIGARSIAACFFIAWLVAFPLSGEIYISLSVLLGLAVFFAAAGSVSKQLFWLSLAFIGVSVGFFSLNDIMLHRFTEQAATRVPWLESSDYFPAWVGGLKTGLSEPIFGVGPALYYQHCMSLTEEQRAALLDFQRCSWHPHNLYIQYFAETGFVGLGLFFTTLLLLFVKAGKVALDIPRSDRMLPAICLATVVMFLWPVATYSGGFGQHMNTHTWFLIGVGLAALSQTKDLLPERIKNLRARQGERV